MIVYRNGGRQLLILNKRYEEKITMIYYFQRISKCA